MQQVQLREVLLMPMLSVFAHVDSIIATMNQHLYLLNQFGRHGLSIMGLLMSFLTRSLEMGCNYATVSDLNEKVDKKQCKTTLDITHCSY